MSDETPYSEIKEIGLHTFLRVSVDLLRRRRSPERVRRVDDSSVKPQVRKS
jgi:hypothetical protein